jgi:O-antigen ligase
VRTEARLKALLFLSVITALVLSVQAINDYRLGLMTVEGYRAAGRGTGIFGNTNDMALHLVTMLPISIAFFFGSRKPWKKGIHVACAAMMIFGIILSYSRGAFLGVLVVFRFFWHSDLAGAVNLRSPCTAFSRIGSNALAGPEWLRRSFAVDSYARPRLEWLRR